VGTGKLCAQVDRGHGGSSFTSALRVFIIEYHRTTLAALRPSVQIGVRY
jgi:predicted DNA-binding ribbon-helix-helix protein